MPKASSHLPKRIVLEWGADRLEIDDPTWIAKIVQEISNNEDDVQDEGRVHRFHPRYRDSQRARLVDPRSRGNETILANLQTMGFSSCSVDPEMPMGYQAPEQRHPVAAEALKIFLGLELPVALNFTNSSGRSEHRMNAVYTYFGSCWSYDGGIPDQLNLCWMFNGYQAYASHHIGAVQFQPYPTQESGHIERRLLNGQWVRWGFDGSSTPPARRLWSSSRRVFTLTASGIQRTCASESDLDPEFDGSELEADNDGGKLPSQEVK